MTPPTTDQDDPADLAGDYTLGLLDGEQRARFERRLAAEPALRAEVAAWERRLAPLALASEPVEPPPTLWPRIEQSLRTAPQPGRPVVGERQQGRGRGRTARGDAGVTFWRWWAVGSTALAAALGGLLLLRPPAGAPGPAAAPRLVAVLNDAQARPAYLVSTTPGAERLNARPVTQLQPGGRVYELWLLPGEDAGQGGGPAAPVSLGLLDPSAGAGRALPEGAARLLTPGRGIAVSLEPPGGSPTGAPTGPIAYTGVLLPDQEQP